jgi:hypothetical protein
MASSIVAQSVKIGEPYLDNELGEFVLRDHDGLEYFGATRAVCRASYSEALRVANDHKRHNPPCTCPAYPFPHREGGGLCGELRYCEHGIPRAEEYCPECERWEAVDYFFDLARDSRLGV